ncbi:MAG: PqqD family protein [Saprospiraceae bacterium]|nr:PqqD family protein [Saprospiraceae bacterium]
MRLKKSIAISENGFVFNAAKGESFSTNPIGLLILELIKSGKDLKRVQQEITDRYAIDASTAERDILDFIKVLKQYSLLD